jgi:adenine deaminase
MVVAEGVDPITAVQMATINVARAYALDHQIGAIAPGLCADMVLIKDLEKFPVAAVWVDGKKIPPADEFVLPNFAFPESVLDTIALKPVSADIFAIKAPADSGTVKVHALDVKEDILISGDLVTDMTVTDGLVHADTANDILKIGVLHRYAPESWHTTGFVRGFGFKKGALAGSIGQDSQNIAVIGVSDEDMAAAVNAVIDMKGGVVMVADGKVLASVELRLGGIMNHTKRPKELLADFEKLNAASRACGGAFTNPSFPLSLMITCACIPDLKITDCALVDAISGQEIPLFA